MDPAHFTRIAAETLYLTLLISLPALGISMIVGLVIGLVQAVTQVQEQTLSFVPKLIAVGIALGVGGSWMGGQLYRFTDSLWQSIPNLIP